MYAPNKRIGTAPIPPVDLENMYTVGLPVLDDNMAAMS
jgi:hypothetical protein